MNSLIITNQERNQYNQPLTENEIVLMSHCILTKMGDMIQNGIEDEKLFIKIRVLNMKISNMLKERI